MAKKSYPLNGNRTPEAEARREVLESWRQSGLPKTEFSGRESIPPDVLAGWMRSRGCARGAEKVTELVERHAKRLGGFLEVPAVRPAPTMISTSPPASSLSFTPCGKMANLFSINGSWGDLSWTGEEGISNNNTSPFKGRSSTGMLMPVILARLGRDSHLPTFLFAETTKFHGVSSGVECI